MSARLKSWLVILLLLGTAVYAIAEEITLTTYYPSPRGVYQELKTAGDMVVGDITNPPAARLHVVQEDAASAFRVDDVPFAFGVYDPSPFLIDQAGNVGIGTTTPQNTLDVEGAAVIGATYAGTNTAPANGLLVEGTVGIGTATPNASALLDLSSTSRGLLPPRMTTVQRDAIAPPPAAPPTGLTIYNTTTGQTEFFNGTEWIPALLWARSPGDPDAIFNTNPGNVGIGITNPSQRLHVVGNIGFGTNPAVTTSTVTGTNPTCPSGSGGFLTRKWVAKTCQFNDSNGLPCGLCTTGAGWFSGVPTCQYNWADGPVCTEITLTCTPDSWTETVCMGN